MGEGEEGVYLVRQGKKALICQAAKPLDTFPE